MDASELGQLRAGYGQTEMRGCPHGEVLDQVEATVSPRCWLQDVGGWRRAQGSGPSRRAPVQGDLRLGTGQAEPLGRIGVGSSVTVFVDHSCEQLPDLVIAQGFEPAGAIGVVAGRIARGEKLNGAGNVLADGPSRANGLFAETSNWRPNAARACSLSGSRPAKNGRMLRLAWCGLEMGIDIDSGVAPGRVR